MSIDEEVLESIEDAQKASAAKRYNDGIALAGAMLNADRYLLLFIYPLLILPSLYVTLVPELSPEIIIGVSLLERVLEVAFFLFIAGRWFRAFFHRSYRLPTAGILWITSVSLVSWAILTFPTFVSLTHASEDLDLLILPLLILLGFLTIRFYFYFFPALTGTSQVSGVLIKARLFCRDHGALPFKLIMAPLAVGSLYLGLVMNLSPDLRSLLVSTLLDLGKEIYWVLSRYLALGVAFAIASRSGEYAGMFEPYVNARFDTMRITAPRWLGAVIHPKNSASIFLAAILVWMGNIARQESTPPAPAILLESISYDSESKTALVTIRAIDKEFHLRGFKPGLFNIQGEGGVQISGTPDSAVSLPDRSDALGLIPRTSDEVELELKLPIINRAEDFVHLTDLSLYYGQVKIVPLKAAGSEAQDQSGAADAEISKITEAKEADLQGSSKDLYM